MALVFVFFISPIDVFFVAAQEVPLENSNAIPDFTTPIPPLAYTIELLSTEDVSAKEEAVAPRSPFFCERCHSV